MQVTCTFIIIAPRRYQAHNQGVFIKARLRVNEHTGKSDTFRQVSGILLAGTRCVAAGVCTRVGTSHRTRVLKKQN